MSAKEGRFQRTGGVISLKNKEGWAYISDPNGHVGLSLRAPPHFPVSWWRRAKGREAIGRGTEDGGKWQRHGMTVKGNVKES